MRVIVYYCEYVRILNLKTVKIFLLIYLLLLNISYVYNIAHSIQNPMFQSNSSHCLSAVSPKQFQILHFNENCREKYYSSFDQ